MENLQELFRWHTYTTEPTIINKQVIQLESQALSVNLPFGGYVWNRPTAVLVGQPGNPTRIPINDPTRAALFAFAGIGLLISIVLKISRTK
ncbi:MAG: hypothetical protein GY943_21345 [Chloroflexi bacterium]|nr:hypothetical protein [Chloroflexota bacterium]